MGIPSDNRSPLVTVLTTAYNAASFIDETLESIRSQTIGDWEYVVVDDASDDATAEIVQRYVEADPRYKLIRRTERGGPFAAANQGLEHVRTRYVARLDADDVAVPDRLEKSIRFLADNPQLRACAGLIDVLVDGKLHRHRLETLPRLVGSVKWSVCVRTFMPCTLLVETDALRELGGYVNLPVAQDHRLTCQLARRRWLGIVPEVLAHWRRHERQISSRSEDLQSRLAADIVGEHLREITGESWTDDDAYKLRRVGYPDLRVRDALRALRRFDRSWRADTALTSAEREELTAFVRELRIHHFKERAAGKLRSFSGGRAVLRLYLRTRGVHEGDKVPA